jgi:hypothetical protein
LTTVLDAVLVNGYGSKPAAGWTKPFSDANNAAYLNAATAKSRAYFNFASGGTIVGYHNMTGPGAGTGAFGNDTSRGWGQGAGDIVGWRAVADNRTLFLQLQRSNNDIRIGIYIGDIVPLIDSDNGCAALVANTTSNAPTGGGWLGASFVYGQTLGLEKYFALKGKPVYDGTAMVGVFALSPCAPSNSNLYWYEQAGVDGRVYVAPMWLYHATTAYGHQSAIRGRLRWLYYVAGAASNYTDNADVSGMGALSGKTLKLFKVTTSISSTPYHHFLAVDLND